MSKYILAAVASLALALPSVGAAQSQHQRYNVDFTGSYPSLSAGGLQTLALCAMDATKTNATYQVVTIELANTTSLLFNMNPSNQNVLANLYSGLVDPADPTLNCIYNVWPSLNKIDLPAGTYSLLIVNQNGTPGQTGHIDINSTQPFTLSQTVPAPIPTLTEWAMMGLGLSLAGLASFSLYRRRRIA